MSCGKTSPADKCYSLAVINIMLGLLATIGGIVLTIYHSFGTNILFSLGGVILIGSGVVLIIGVREKREKMIVTAVVLSLLGWIVVSIWATVEMNKPHIFILNLILLLLHYSVYQYSKEVNKESLPLTNTTALAENNDQSQAPS